MNGIGLAGNILKTLETSSSFGMFARDTGGCLISRLAISRSGDESREISIAELTESALFYFSAPFLAKGTAGMFAKKMEIEKDLMLKPVKDIEKLDFSVRKKIKLGKFGQIASTVGLILPAVFAIAPLRNMVTLGKTGKENFTNVIELDKTKHEQKIEQAKEKTKSLCKKLAIISAGILGTTIGFLTFAKNKNFYKKTEPFVNKTIKHFDFTKSGDLELMHYGALIYPVSIASYFYASRDKYEVMENARRFSVTVPLMFFGEKLIQNPIHKKADKIFGTNIFNNGNIKSYDEILKMPEDVRKKSVRAKNLAYGSTFFINTMAIAAGVALLNRYETQKRYKNEHRSELIPVYSKDNEDKPIWQDMKI